MNHVVAKEKILLDNVPNQSAEVGDVGSGADWHPDVGQRAGSGEARINVDNGRAAFFSFHDPAESHWVGLSHGGAFDQDAIGVRQILLRGRSSAPAKGGAQTGHRAAMSYPGLVGYAYHPQA